MWKNQQAWRAISSSWTMGIGSTEAEDRDILLEMFWGSGSAVRGRKGGHTSFGVYAYCEHANRRKYIDLPLLACICFHGRSHLVWAVALMRSIVATSMTSTTTRCYRAR
jgi:hypothetical protein